MKVLRSTGKRWFLPQSSLYYTLLPNSGESYSEVIRVTYGYRLNCVFQKLISWSTPIWWCLKMTLWEIIEFRWHHEGGVFMMGLVPLRKERHQSSHSPSSEGAVRTQLSTSQEEGPAEIKSADTLILTFPASRTVRWEIDVCYLSHLV